MDNKIIKRVIGCFFIGSVIFLIIIWSSYNLSYPEWLNMLTSFVGAITGGMATLIAVYFSIKQNDNIQNTNRMKQIEPIVDFNMKDGCIVTLVEEEGSIRFKGMSKLNFEILNLSDNVAKNVDFRISMKWSDLIELSNTNGIQIEYGDNDKDYLGIKNRNELIGFCPISKKEYYEYNSFDRYIFKNKYVEVNFAAEPILYKEFFTALLKEYIYNNKDKFMLDVAIIEKEIAKFKITLIYNDIDDNKYSKKSELSVILYSIDIGVDEDKKKKTHILLNFKVKNE